MGWSLGYLPGQDNRGSCVGEGSKTGQCCCWLTSWGLPGPHPISSHFTHFPYATGAPSAAVLVIVPRVGNFAYVLAVSSAPPPPHWVYRQKWWGFIFLSVGALGCVVWPGAGLTCSQGVSLIFIHHMWMWVCPLCHLAASLHHTESSLRWLPISSNTSGWIWLL